MKEDVVVVFEKHNARILHGVDAAKYVHREGHDALINPKFPPGVPPHYWKIENGAIGIHEPQVVKEREAHLHAPIVVTSRKRPVQWELWVCIGINIALAAAGVAAWLTHHIQ